MEGDHVEMTPIYKPRSEASQETDPAHAHISGFQPPDLRENHFLLFPVSGALCWPP